MGAAGRNIVKMITGSALGAGVGTLVSKAAERSQNPPVETEAPADDLANEANSFLDRLRSRWEYAREAGEQARLEREAELTDYFREKVNDQGAFQRNGSENQ